MVPYVYNPWKIGFFLIVIANIFYHASTSLILLFSLLMIFGYIFYFFTETFNKYAHQENQSVRYEFVSQYRRLYSAISVTRQLLYKTTLLPNFLSTLLLLWNTNVLLYKCNNFPLTTNYFFTPLSEFYSQEVDQYENLETLEDFFSYPVDSELFLETQIELLHPHKPSTTSQQYGELLSF